MTPNISIKQIQVLVAVAQHGSITQAANQLCQTKAAVSMALSELENQLNRQLFDRHNNRLQLNHHGEALLPLADELLQKHQDIKQFFRKQGALFGTLKIGASNTVGNYLLPHLIKGFREQTLHRDQQILIHNTETICHQLNDFQLDLALVEGEVRHEQLTCHPWLQDQMCIIAPPNHPLTQEPLVSPQRLSGEQWITREAGSGSREQFIRHLVPHIGEWHKAMELPNSTAMIHAVNAGLGLSCISSLAAQSAIENELVAQIKTPIQMVRQFWLVQHQQKHPSALHEAFIEYCKCWQMPTMTSL